jgi:short-subunit dehydrogenase
VKHPWKTALVTGASSGIGLEMVRALGRAGVPTVVVARRRDRLDELASRWPDIEVLTADLTTESGMTAVSERLADVFRPVDLLVNNAGFGTSGSFVDIPVERSADEVKLNVEALVRLSHAALEGMVARQRGWVLNVSSVASFQSAPGLATYAATKAFVTSFTEALHEEVVGTPVHVTALCPGLTRTEFQSVSNQSGAPGAFPPGAWLDAADVAAAGLIAVARGKALCVPGWRYKVLVAASNVSPRYLTRKVSRAVRTRTHPR